MAKTEKILIDNICPLHDLECEKAVLGTLTSPVLSNGEIPELEIIAYEKEDTDRLIRFMMDGAQ